jgi:hypothetical protein
MSVVYNGAINLQGLRHYFDLNNTKSYTTGATMKDLITGSQGTNGIANASASWMNSGVYAITITAVVKRLTAISSYSVNPFTKYTNTTDNTFNLYMFGNNSGTAPGDDGRLGFYSNLNGGWQSVATQYGCALNETVIYTLQFNTVNGGQTWANTTKLGSRGNGGRLGSVGNTSSLFVASPTYSSALRLEAALIYDRELSDQEILSNSISLKSRYGIA